MTKPQKCFRRSMNVLLLQIIFLLEKCNVTVTMDIWDLKRPVFDIHFYMCILLGRKCFCHIHEESYSFLNS